MFKQKKGFIAGFTMCAVVCLLAGTVLAASRQATLNVTYSDIKLYVDGVLVTPKDVNGNIVEPFACQGTTYLPIRALSEALGKSVRWDGSTSSVIVGLMPGEVVYFDDIMAPYQFGGNYWLASIAKGEYILIAGNKYYHGATNTYGFGNPRESGFYNLDAQYSQLSGMYGPRDDYARGELSVNFYGDGRLIKALEFSSGDMPRDFSIDLTGVLQLRVELCGAGASVVNWQIK